VPRTPSPARRAGRLALLAALALSLAACGVAAPALTAPFDGSSSTAGRDGAAPFFTVPLLGGGAFDLATHLSRDGRPVLLSLWTPECAPCQQEMASLDEAAARHPEVLFLGIAVGGDASAVAAAVAEAGVAYPVGFDEFGTVDAAFPTALLPATYLIDSEGRMLGMVQGPLARQELDLLIADHLGG
jgi:cytochrome c biogenesis protein CcmG, thiol:disulfide interchange protein DsbE